MQPRILCSIFSLIFILASAPEAYSQSEACLSATRFLSRNQQAAYDGMLLATGGMRAGDWKIARPIAFGRSEIVINADMERLTVAYIRGSVGSGAVAVRIALIAESGSKTNEVNLYRSGIDRGSNRCERRGRSALQKSIRLNQYIDYHNSPSVSSSLEDFHFSYPTGGDGCMRTDNANSIKAFQFEDVARTEGDTFFARNFRVIGTAYAINHNYSVLRSELHYQASSQSPMSCVSFDIPLNGAKRGTLVINEQGFSGFPVSRTWTLRAASR